MLVETKRTEAMRIDLIVTQTVTSTTEDYEIDNMVKCFRKHLLKQRETLKEACGEESLYSIGS